MSLSTHDTSHTILTNIMSPSLSLLEAFSSVYHSLPHSLEKQQQLDSWSNLVMATDLEESLPSYDSTLGSTGGKLFPADSIFQQDLHNAIQLTLPPSTNYLVRAQTDPSAWKLLQGPAMSNAITPTNTIPLRKRRYAVVYPPSKYEDVYLHKSAWSTSTSSLPRYHVEVSTSKDRYEPEPIIILGPTDHSSARTNEVRNLAACHVDRVCSRIEEEVTKATRFAAFCESEYFSWHWSCKFESAREDMRIMIRKAQSECLKSLEMIGKLEDYLAFVGEKEVRAVETKALRHSILESNVRMDRLRP